MRADQTRENKTRESRQREVTAPDRVGEHPLRVRTDTDSGLRISREFDRWKWLFGLFDRVLEEFPDHVPEVRNDHHGDCLGDPGFDPCGKMTGHRGSRDLSHNTGDHAEVNRCSFR